MDINLTIAPGHVIKAGLTPQYPAGMVSPWKPAKGPGSRMRKYGQGMAYVVLRWRLHMKYEEKQQSS